MLHAHDRILGILPFFHSFGFTGTLCLPAATGIGVVFHPNPLDSRVIGALVSKYAVTMLLATRSEEHTSELQSRLHLVCRLLLEKKKNIKNNLTHAAHVQY